MSVMRLFIFFFFFNVMYVLRPFYFTFCVYAQSGLHSAVGEACVVYIDEEAVETLRAF